MKDLLARFRIDLPAPKPKTPLDALFGKSPLAFEPLVDLGDRRKGKPVAGSEDLDRVLALTRRDKPDLETLASELTARLTNGAATCQCQRFERRCAKHLKPVQAWALSEAARCGGLLGPIGVGDGKTLLDLLTPMVMPSCQVAVLLIPPGLRDQLEVDFEFYSQHWKLPNLTTGRWHNPGRPWLHVIAFSELSGAKSTDLLERIKPDLIVVDEAHSVRNRTAARTKRFLRYFGMHPETRLCAWSGTLTSRSLRDYAHLSTIALREGSPTPHHWPTVEEWAGAIDPSDFPSPMGALRKLCQPGEHIHKAWRRRLHDTPGVVASVSGMSCDASIQFHERKVKAPPAILSALSELRASWDRPDGDKLVQIVEVARCARQLSAGFFYRWRWPRGEPVEVIEAWLEARKAWHKELRHKLQWAEPHMDSPLLCAKAAIRFFDGYQGHLPTWRSLTWPAWRDIREKAKPETEAVWVDDFLVRDAATWANEEPGIVWYEFDEFGRKVAEAGGLPFYGPGDDAAEGILREKGNRSVVASIRAHGTGRNLQMFNRQLVANPPSDGGTWEQMLGRTHRDGQKADLVEVFVYRHTAEMVDALDRARLLASYIEGTMGNQQRLLRASYGFT